MIRTLFSLLLALAVAAEASAQTAPATATKTTARTKTATRRAVRKTPRTTTRKTSARKTGATSAPARPAAETGGRNDIGPGGNGARGSTASADGQGQGVYAAPGMSVKVGNPRKVGNYDGSPAGTPARTRGGTTLTPRK